MTCRRITSSGIIGSQRNTNVCKGCGGCSTPDTGSRARLREAGDPRQISRAATAGGPTTTGASWGTLPKWLIARIRASEYIDFAELPPAKGKSRKVSQAMEGQVVVVQATDWLQSRKIIPDLATWSQCFAL